MVAEAIICSFTCDPVILSGRKAWSRCLTGACIFEGKREQIRVESGGWVVSVSGGDYTEDRTG